MIRKIIASVVILVLIIIGGYQVINYMTWNSKPSASNVPVSFEITEGESVEQIGDQLEDKNLIENKYLFYYYIWQNKIGPKIKAGEYSIEPNKTIPQLIEILTEGENISRVEKLVVPEGFTSQKIVNRIGTFYPELALNFEKISSCTCFQEENCDCGDILKNYDFLKTIPFGVDVEGYLFPDTYFIDKKENAEKVAQKFLNNFNKQVDDGLRRKMEEQGRSLHEVITLASVIEKEVRTPEDRRIVAGIFWQRLEDEYPLQSCATLAYVLGINKSQYSQVDTEIESPYNTYQNAGLPPGPISNPGLDSIKAAVDPIPTDYYFFLTDPETGETVFSKTIEEHNRNKAKYGL